MRHEPGNTLRKLRHAGRGRSLATAGAEHHHRRGGRLIALAASPSCMFCGGDERRSRPAQAAGGGAAARCRPSRSSSRAAARSRARSPRPARSPRAATSRSASPAKAAWSARCWSMPAAGSARARCWRRSIARSSRRTRRSLPPRSRSRAPMPRWPRTNMSAAQALVGRGFVSKADLDRKKAARDAANARVRVAQAKLGATRAQIGRLDIRAPTRGLILSRNVEVGQVVSAGAGALFRLAEGGEMEMRAANVAAGPGARSASACRPASRRSAPTAASPGRSGRSRR